MFPSYFLMLLLSEDNQTEVTGAINPTSRYLADLMNIDDNF